MYYRKLGPNSAVVLRSLHVKAPDLSSMNERTQLLFGLYCEGAGCFLSTLSLRFPPKFGGNLSELKYDRFLRLYI